MTAPKITKTTASALRVGDVALVTLPTPSGSTARVSVDVTQVFAAGPGGVEFLAVVVPIATDSTGTYAQGDEYALQSPDALVHVFGR